MQNVCCGEVPPAPTRERRDPDQFDAGTMAALGATSGDILRLENELRRTEALLRAAERIAHIGGWRWEIAYDTLIWSEEVYRVFGRDPSGPPPRHEDFIAAIHPDDRQRVRDAIVATTTRGARWDIQYRIIRPDGTERLLQAQAEPGLDAAGRLICMTGTVLDITERERAREHLEASEERFRLLVEEAPDAILLYDFDQRRFVSANKAAERLFACGREEIIQYGPDHFYPPDQPDGRPVGQSFADHNRRVLSGEQVRHERRIINAAGEERRCEVTLVSLPLGRGHVMRASMVDVTEQRRADERWRASLEAAVGAVATAVELRDPYTAGHQQRVASLAVAIAREIGLTEDQIHGLYLGSAIHDVGKMALPAEILSKPGKLSNIELQLIQVHAQAGYDIIKDVDFPWPVAEIVRQHHERLDGSGYPRGLAGDAILLEARILAVADVVDAMMSHRPYRSGRGIDVALAEIEAGKGKLYDSAAVDACVTLFRERRFSF